MHATQQNLQIHMKHAIIGFNPKAPKCKTLYKILKSSCKPIYGNELFHVDGQTHTMKLKVTFHNFRNIGYLRIVLQLTSL
jgi:hypothetical protein